MPGSDQHEHNPPFFCESCKNRFAMGTQVKLEDGSALPVCGLCWNQLTVGQRVKIASDIKHQRAMRDLFETLGGWLDLAERLYPPGNVAGEDAAGEDDGSGEAWLN